MEDGDYDFCECVSHELAMAQLLSRIRNAMNYCTDTECPNELPQPGGLEANVQDNSIILMFMMCIFAAVVMFFLRPKSLRPQISEKRSEDNDSNGSPPPAVN